MSTSHAAVIAAELDISQRQIEAVLDLLSDGATIPFIARYRKERTGSLDEVALQKVRDTSRRLTELDARKQTVLQSLDEQGVSDGALRDRIARAATRAEVEDLYLPYRPKRRTRGTIAKERGLQPLADRIWAGGSGLESKDALARAAHVLTGEDLPDVDSVLSGVRDILAERISEEPAVRAEIRTLFRRSAVLSSKRSRRGGSGAGEGGHRGADSNRDDAEKYRDYFDWHEPASRAPSHRVLAIMRGTREGVLSCHVLPPEEAGKAATRRVLEKRHSLPRKSAARFELLAAAEDSYARLLAPQLETETRSAVVERAEAQAVSVFARNLRELLMAPPLGRRRVLAVDPGFRTGCKVVALSEAGDVLRHETIYPLEPKNQTERSRERLSKLASEYRCEAVAVGNGTGGRETMAFCRSIGLADEVIVTMVDESGASVYSAGESARREFPDLDVTVRGAISIGRRLQDPLAELVKVEPQSIGVGQYQHDVDQKLLSGALHDVVVSCVNAVGVEVNTASPALLRFVSGISERLADSIVAYRAERGGFTSRREFLDVPGLGARTFELAAGFLRIRDGVNPLDAGAVHPERYELVERMAGETPVADLVGNAERVARITPEDFVTDEVGLPTIRDILCELAKPGRDPRTEFEPFSFTEGVESIDDLTVGMTLPGIVTNVTAFGAFVDIGVHTDGLVHVSKMADRFVRDPHEIVKVHEQVMVSVVSIDKERSRIGLSMRQGGSDE